MEIQALDTFMLVALALPLIALWVVTFWDIARRRDLTVTRKIMWSLVIVITAYIGIALYAIMRPVPPPPGKARSASLPRASAIVGALEALVASHDAGDIPDATFDGEKRKILGIS